MGDDWRAEAVIAGNKKALQAVRELITYPPLDPPAARKLGIKWPKGLLLYGPPGTGKTSLVKAVVTETRAHLTEINRSSVSASCAGESEKYLRDTFSKASAISGKPSVIFIDEIDFICPPRDNKKEDEVRIVAQLLTLMDGLESKRSPHNIVVIAATNRINEIDPAIRRHGRFDKDIEVSVPTIDERFQILKLYSKGLKLDDGVDLKAIAFSCNGYVGADLESLCREADMLANRRMSTPYSDINNVDYLIKMEDFEKGKEKLSASITRGLTKNVAKVTWDDIGGHKYLKKKLKRAVEWPKHREAYERVGIDPTRGVLLHGPPGCGKTALAQAAAHAAQASFFSFSGKDLKSKYVGEGEELLRSTFEKARLASPSILFFDEFEAVAPKREAHADNSDDKSGERLLTTFLTEMNGLEDTKGIIVFAATNRPQKIDGALLRPGRFDMVLYVPPPNVEGRHEILKIKTKSWKLGEDVNLMELAEETESFTGRDLDKLCKEAYVLAKEDSSRIICSQHFQHVFFDMFYDSDDKTVFNSCFKKKTLFNLRRCFCGISGN